MKLIIALSLVGAWGLAGCSSITGERIEKPLPVDDRIKLAEKHIEEVQNSKLPPGIKAQQIGMLKANLERMKQSRAGGKVTGVPTRGQ